jgi:hypothetical protein
MFRIDLECRCGHRWDNRGVSSDMEEYKQRKADGELQCPNCGGNRIKLDIVQLFMDETEDVPEGGYYYDDNGVRHAGDEVPY